MKRLFGSLLVWATLGGLAFAADARGLVVESRVVDVQPLTRTIHEDIQVGDCDPVKPAAADLLALLAWDLRVDCRREQRTRQQVTGYRVVHLVDGQRFEQVMEAHPGDTIKVRLTVR